MRLAPPRPAPLALARFSVTLFASRPEGATTFQPRASPWGPNRMMKKPALKGRNKRAGQSLVSPFQGWVEYSFASDPQGVALGFFVSAPSGLEKSETSKLTRRAGIIRHRGLFVAQLAC